MNKTSSAPDLADQHRRYLALAMLAVAVLSAANAAERVVSPELAQLMEWVEVAMVVLVAAALAPMMWWKLRNRDESLQQVYLSEDGFVAQSLHRAKSASWVVTFVLLSGLPAFAKRFNSVPSEFFVYLTTAVMVGVFATAFFFLSRDSGDVHIDAADA